MGWIAEVNVRPWVGGMFHLRGGDAADRQTWPDVAAAAPGSVVSSDHVITVPCDPHLETVAISILTLEDIGPVDGVKVHSQELSIPDGTMRLGTVEGEATVVFDGRPARLTLAIFASRKLSRFTVAVDDGLSGRALIDAADDGDDLLDYPANEVEELDALVAVPRAPSAVGLPLLCVYRDRRSGEQRLASYRADPRRFEGWNQDAFIWPSPLAARVSARLRSSPRNLLRAE